MSSLKIGSVTLPHGLMLAPMAGVTDTAFRLLCRQFGAEYAVTEMVSAKALCFEQRQRAGKPLRTAPIATIEENEAPTAVQLFGNDPTMMAEAARLLASGTYQGFQGVLPVAIDINMGCPVAKVVDNGEGSALLKSPALAAEIVRQVKEAVSIPVTVKIRAGFYRDQIVAPEFAKRLEQAGADLICVHGRTRQQFYAPSSDNGVIKAVKEAVSVPVIGNGDLFSAEAVQTMLQETNCDGVAIARGAQGNPFLFAEIVAALESRPYTPPTPAERLAVALSHAADLAARKGEHIGLAEARKHMLWYCKGLRGSNAARVALTQATTLREIKAIFDTLLEANE